MRNPATILTIYDKIPERMIRLVLGIVVEEPVMRVRFVLIAAASLAGGTAFAAEPVKPPAQPAAQRQPAPAQVVLASADELRVPSTTEQPQTAPKRPRGRVTTCRCGDSEAQPEQ
jgi:hypothetical protein